jgi:hypothetical protein
MVDPSERRPRCSLLQRRPRWLLVPRSPRGCRLSFCSARKRTTSPSPLSSSVASNGTTESLDAGNFAHFAFGVVRGGPLWRRGLRGDGLWSSPPFSSLALNGTTESLDDGILFPDFVGNPPLLDRREFWEVSDTPPRTPPPLLPPTLAHERLRRLGSFTGDTCGSHSKFATDATEVGLFRSRLSCWPSLLRVHDLPRRRLFTFWFDCELR